MWNEAAGACSYRVKRATASDGVYTTIKDGVEIEVSNEPRRYWANSGELTLVFP